MATQLDPYLVLGVSATSEDVVIRAAFKALMLKYHPDTNKSPGATTRAACINEAFGILGDSQRRAAYDATRAATPPKPYSNPSSSPLSSGPKRSLRKSGMAVYTLESATKSEWFARGRSITAIVLLVAMMGMAVGGVNGMSFDVIMMNSFYITEDNQIDTSVRIENNGNDDKFIYQDKNIFIGLKNYHGSLNPDGISKINIIKKRSIS